MSPRRCLSLLAFALAGALAASADAAVPAGPAGLDFYTTPTGKIAGKHGSVIWARAIKGGSLPKSGKSWLVLYRSVNPNGEKTVPVSGIVTLPKGKAPNGGFPVISWAHGTTGIADSCAPSRDATKPPDNVYARNFQAEATHWVKEGFAVAQTDYQGLGTPGLHPYLIGQSEGRSVVDIVSAARALSKRVGKRWAAIGHSQGGHATLWAAALGPKYAPGLKLQGAAPLAPASHVGEQSAAIKNVPGNPYGGLPALIVTAGLERGGFSVDAALSDSALALYPQVDQICLDKLSEQDSWGGLALKEIFREGYDTTPLTTLIGANDPEDLTIKVPLLIAQGKSDTTVFPAFTDSTVSDLRGRGTKVIYKQYEGINHTGVVEASRADTDKFLARLLGG